MQNLCKRGFTLAEVLITLMIIGVIASITIPGLINDVQNQQYKVAWKKAFAEFSQASLRMMSDNGGTLEGLFSDTNDGVNHYAAYFSVIKSCNPNQGTPAEGNCWPLAMSRINSSSYFGGNTGRGLLLSNGVGLVFANMQSICNGSSAAVTETMVANIIGQNSICGSVLFDVNGLSPPNKIGKDIFGALIYKNKIVPYNSEIDPTEFDFTNNGYGYSATFLYQ
jgi:prepilin-type N-terminal cleavage/methylation domain-containing protein